MSRWTDRAVEVEARMASGDREHALAVLAEGLETARRDALLEAIQVVRRWGRIGTAGAIADALRIAAGDRS